jgi:hypothetical protein
VFTTLVAVIFFTPLNTVAREKTIANVTAYADVEVCWSGGDVKVQKVKAGRFAKPTEIKRFRGRFTAIVAKEKKAINEVDFDFPLLSADPEEATDEAKRLGETVRKGLTTCTTVRLPWPEGADTLVIYDNATRKEVKAPLKESSSAPPAASPSGAPRAR